MVAIVCFCGAAFDSVDFLCNHALQRGHRFMCSCGSCFAVVESVVHHQKSVEHLSAAYTEHPSLKDYDPESAITKNGPIKCSFCPNRKPFQEFYDLFQHKAEIHPSCPKCGQTFPYDKKDSTARQLRRGHQKVTDHCYCAEHDRAFTSTMAYNGHVHTETHVTGFQCLDCDREFTTQQGLDDHLEACAAVREVRSNVEEERAAAALAQAEENNLRCEPCNREFKTLDGLRSHKSSVKHQPLSDIKCFLSTECSQTFTSPSAWLLHVESGTCKSRINRQVLNALAHAHDTERHITSVHDRPAVSHVTGLDRPSTSSVTGSVATDLAAIFAGLSISSSTDGGVILTPPEASDLSTGTFSNGVTTHTPEDSIDTVLEGSDASEVILTPNASSTWSSTSSTDGGVMLSPDTPTQFANEWSFINDGQTIASTTASLDESSADTVTYDNIKKAWACTLCDRKFKKKYRLLAHLNSPAHAPKIFHCPPAAAPGLLAAKGEKKFKTLSGLAQHIETTACSGGMDLLVKVAGIFEQRIQIATGRDVKLLRSG